MSVSSNQLLRQIALALAVGQGMSWERISQILKVDVSTITQWASEDHWAETRALLMDEDALLSLFKEN